MWQPHTTPLSQQLPTLREQEETTNVGREPGRSKADRLQLFARRGRFSPLFFIILIAGLLGVAGLFSSGHAGAASGKNKKSAQRVQKTQKKSSPSKATSPRASKPRYKDKQRQTDGRDRPSGKTKVPRPPKPQPIGDNSSNQVQPRPRPPHPPPIWPPGPPPQPIVVYVYEDFDQERTDINGEATLLLFTASSMVFNGVYIAAGESNGWAAAAGMFFGVTSMVVAAREDAKYSQLDIVLGAVSVALSVWNLAGGVQRTDPYYDDFPYASDTAFAKAQPQSVSYSFSF